MLTKVRALYNIPAITSMMIDNLFCVCVADDVIYNQAGGSATMKRNGGDMRDELGYIPPPNRKLPPVPGTQYNTCDRIKRGNYLCNISIFYQTNFFFGSFFGFLN